MKYKVTSNINVSYVTLNISTLCDTMEMKESQAEPYLGRQIKKGFQKNNKSGTNIEDALEMKNINSKIWII